MRNSCPQGKPLPSFLLPVMMGCICFNAAIVAQEKTAIQMDAGSVVDQAIYLDSRAACGPTSMANSLIFGPLENRAAWQGLPGGDNERRLRLLIDRYFKNKTSLNVPNSKRWIPQSGVTCPDLLAAYREILSDSDSTVKVNGSYTQRNGGESDEAFARRIHGWLEQSLRRNIPPILSLRSYIFRNGQTETEPAHWEVGEHHFVVATSVPKKWRSDVDSGITFDLIDPRDAKVSTGFIFPERRQGFVAQLGEHGAAESLSGRHFLVVQAPEVLSLTPENVTHADRVVIVLNYVIGDFTK